MQISYSLNSLAGGLFIALLFMQCFSVQSQYYTSAEQHFINCGSKSEFTLNSRKFIADINSEGEVSSTSTATIIPLYQTAKVFTNQSRYRLPLETNGTYVVRLHFYPFSSSVRNLLDANFSVSASQFSLLSNFRVYNSEKLPVIKEFIFFIQAGNFEIIFTPRKSSSAFVSAIETFLAPKDILQISVPRVSQSGRDKDDYNDLLYQILRPVYRINVGGGLLDHDNDTWWRNWIPDDEFLYNKEVARNQSYNGKLNYLSGGANENSAPELVYKTAKELNKNLDSEYNFFNITWQFNVTTNIKYFIRVHFCDIVNPSQNFIKFKFYIYSNFSFEITDSENPLRAPFYYDFVVDSDTSGLLNISIGPGVENQTAFLNGLEIMELMNDRSLDGLAKKKTDRNVLIIIIIGSVVGGVAFVLVLIFTIGRRKAKAVENSDWPLKMGELDKIVDPSLVGKINPSSLRKFGETAAKCLKDDGADRPTMVDVIWDLEYALQLQREPLEGSSNTDVSWAMPLPGVQRLPSTSMTIKEDEMHLGINDILDSSYENATDVFSQLRIDDAR
ncbi:Protein kinase domain-containing protein [Heracleum sosnowskyi]|uniref:Protein kinase domain-containing protein n=1 Tax=Heracleum sosnowskyi TaxID=360622 RepID=A0AAD8IYC4_9APIA|nr:Protein kinase domain-containing protein [Heracleum sosnowskyi]